MINSTGNQLSAEVSVDSDTIISSMNEIKSDVTNVCVSFPLLCLGMYSKRESQVEISHKQKHVRQKVRLDTHGLQKRARSDYIILLLHSTFKRKVALTPSFYGIYDAIRILRKYSSLLIHRVERGPNGPGRPRGIYTPIIQLLQTDFHEKHSLALDFI